MHICMYACLLCIYIPRKKKKTWTNLLLLLLLRSFFRKKIFKRQRRKTTIAYTRKNNEKYYLRITSQTQSTRACVLRFQFDFDCSRGVQNENAINGMYVSHVFLGWGLHMLARYPLVCCCLCLRKLRYTFTTILGDSVLTFRYCSREYIVKCTMIC